MLFFVLVFSAKSSVLQKNAVQQKEEAIGIIVKLATIAGRNLR